MVSASITSNYLRNSTNVQTPNTLPVRSLFKGSFSLKKKKKKRRVCGVLVIEFVNLRKEKLSTNCPRP